MTHELEDSDLRRQFRVLRDAIGQTAPPFRPPAHRASRPRRAPVWAIAAVLAALAAGTVWVVTRSSSQPHQSLVALDATWWVAPTDFLLSTPGTELLRSVPSIGDGMGADPVPAPIDSAESSERIRS